MKHPFFVTAVVLLSILLFSSSALAGVFTVAVPSESVSSENLITIPVTVSGAEKLGGYKIYVYNYDSDSRITINSSQPISGNWDVNSDVSRQYQIVSFTVTDTVGLTGDYTLFSIDVLPLNQQLDTIPVNISVIEVYDVNAVEVTNEYTWENGVIKLQSGNPASCTISFDANGGTGSLSPIFGSSGKSYILPECTFTAPAGKEFKAWLIGSAEYQPGDYYTPSASVTAKALWIDAVGVPGEFAVICPGPGSIISSTDSFTVNWTAASGALGYTFSLRDRTISETEDAGKLINNEDIGNVLNYTIPSDYLISGHDYRLAVCAYNDAGKTWEEAEFTIAPTECLHLNTTKQSITRNGISEDFPMDAGDGTHYWYVNEICTVCNTILNENVVLSESHNANALSMGGVCECNYHMISAPLNQAMYAEYAASVYLVPAVNSAFSGGSLFDGEKVMVLAEGLGNDGTWSLVQYSVIGTSREKIRFVKTECLSANEDNVVVTIFYPTEDTVCLTNEKVEIHWIASENTVAEYAVKLYSDNGNLLCPPGIIRGNNNTYNYNYTVPTDMLSKLSGFKIYEAVVTALSDKGEVLGEDSVVFTIEDRISTSIFFTSCINGTKSSSYDVHYSEGYFSGDSRIYNHKLAQVSLGLAAASYTAPGVEYIATVPKNAEKQRYANIADAYQKLGFTNVDYYNYDVSLSDTSDKVAYSIAKKETRIGGKDTVLFVIVPRSGAYGGEWASNFNIGTGPYSEGFYRPAIMILETFKEELATVSDSAEIKVWTTGFSRGAAVSNLFAGELTRNADVLGLKQENIYAYNFATPQGVDTTYEINKDVHTDYTNIINIVNPSDIVTNVPMTPWGFDRYGIIYYFDYDAAKAPYQNQTIFDTYRDINNGLLEDEKYVNYTPTNLVSTISSFSIILSDVFDSKYMYDTSHSHYLEDLLSIIFYERDMDVEKLFQMPSSLTYIYDTDEVTNAHDIVSAYISENENADFEYYHIINTLPWSILIDSFSETVLGIDSCVEKIDSVIEGVMTVGVINGFTPESASDEISRILSVIIRGLIIIYFGVDDCNNPSIIMMQHYHEVYMAWMSTATSNTDLLTDSNDAHTKLLSRAVDVFVVADGEGVVSGSQRTLPDTNVLISAYPDYGHEFVGWYDESGILVSTDEQYMAFVDSLETTFTAKFQHGYTIEYNLDGGTNNPNNPSRYYITDSDIILKEPSRSSSSGSHYEFIGWTWEGQKKPLEYVVIPAGSSGKMVFTAHWKYVSESTDGQVAVPESNIMTIEIPNLGDEYRVEVSKIPNLSPLVGSTGNKPVNLIHGYDIAATVTSSQVGVATIEFCLDTTDLPVNVNPQSIFLYHKEAGKWVQLPTTYIKADADKYWYSAETTSFSPFAIGYELEDVFAILSPEANQELTTTSPLEVSWSGSSGALGYTITLRDNGLNGAGSSETVIDAADVGASLNYVIPSSYLINGHEYQIVVSAYNSTGSVSTESVFSVALVSQIQEITNTTATFNAQLPAEVSYTVSPDSIGSLRAPVLTKSGLTLTINDVTVEKVIGSISTLVPAEVLANGEVSVTGDISDAESLTVSFMGRKLGDVTNDGKPDTLDAARVLQASVGLYAFSNADTFYGDVSGDGLANTLDAARILQYSVSLVDENYVTKA